MNSTVENNLKTALIKLEALEKRVVELEHKQETTAQTFERMAQQAKKKAEDKALLAIRDAEFDRR